MAMKPLERHTERIAEKERKEMQYWVGAKLGANFNSTSTSTTKLFSIK